ncbi:MAG: 2OG-Fe(II) oxygenase [Janthinobacterium lividum]
MMPFLNTVLLREFDAERFVRRAPYPWQDFTQLLTPEGFARLYADFPPLAAFQHHIGLPRADGQRSHDRYYLAYEASLYHRAGRGDYALEKRDGEGTIGHADLPPSWQAFIDELRDPQGYAGIVSRALDASAPTIRFAWHLGRTGSEVSPHHDARDKRGTHIFYFNTSDDWRPEWGGAFDILSGKQVARGNPDFDDFAASESVGIIDNRSFLFKNTTDAWHGVRTLTCPEGAYRRLFNVVFEQSDAPSRGIAGRVRRLFSRPGARI